METYYIIKKTAVAADANKRFVEYYGKHNQLLAAEGDLPDFDDNPYVNHPLWESLYDEGYTSEKKAKTNRTYRSPDKLNGWIVSVEIIKVERDN